MSKNTPNAIPGKKGFQKTGRAERGKTAPTAAPVATGVRTGSTSSVDYAAMRERLANATQEERLAEMYSRMHENSLREEIWHTDTMLEKGFEPGPQRGKLAEQQAELNTKLVALMGEADRRGLVDADGNLKAPERPAYRKEWTDGARAYPEADTFEALKESMKRKRKSYMVHMPNSGEAGREPCSSCGTNLGDPYRVNKDDQRASALDRYSTWTVNPKTKTAVGQHYYCSWGSLMNRVYAQSRAL